MCAEEEQRKGIRVTYKKHDPDLCCCTCRYFQAADWYVRSDAWRLAKVKQDIFHDVEPHLWAATLARNMVGFAESPTIKA